MSVLGRAYLWISLLVLGLGLLWFVLVLQENRAWVEVILLVPRFDLVDPLVRTRFRVNVAMVLVGWGGCVGLLALTGIVAPFRVRSMALLQRRLRELEREILELRTLPLRQQEEDEILAAEAHLDIRAKKVMTEKMRRDRMLRDDDGRGGGGGGEEEGDARDLHAPLGRAVSMNEFRAPQKPPRES